MIDKKYVVLMSITGSACLVVCFLFTFKKVFLNYVRLYLGRKPRFPSYLTEYSPWCCKQALLNIGHLVKVLRSFFDAIYIPSIPRPNTEELFLKGFQSGLIVLKRINLQDVHLCTFVHLIQSQGSN